jgi:hypothetical protein
LIARTTNRDARPPHQLGNYVSDGVGNYVSVTPPQVGNSVSADKLAEMLLDLARVSLLRDWPAWLALSCLGFGSIWCIT